MTASARRVQIYILSRDRVLYFRQALESVIAASGGLAEIVVSDNSESDEIQSLVEKEYSDVLYVRRRPTLSVYEHFRVILNEASAEFLVMFHDDDIMMPDYVTEMVAALDADERIAAVGCDALLLRDQQTTGHNFMGRSTRPVLVENVSDFLEPYLAFSTWSYPPFPGYMYRRKFISGLYLEPEEGGKHTDVSFLAKILSRGAILWLSRPLMWYRFHGSNDSGKETVIDRLTWLRYMALNHGLNQKSPSVREFRFRYWLRWWMQREGRGAFAKPSGWREKVILRFLLFAGVRIAMNSRGFWQKVFRKIPGF
jgi:glycosyltransferase involved in cell wall biosynthesis